MEMEPQTLLYILCILLGIIAGFCAGYGMSFSSRTAGKNTTVWGQKFDPIPAVRKGDIIGVAGWLLFVFSVGLSMYTFFAIDDPWGESPFVWIIIGIGVGGIIAALPGGLIGDKKVSNVLMNSKNALFLEKWSIMQHIDTQIGNAKAVAIFADRIALYDERDYNFFTAIYADYSLGRLTDSTQIWLLGYYFRQKYRTQFKHKPKVDTVYITNGHVTLTNDVNSISFVRQNKG